ncbi:MAG: hypothetical protein TEF_19040 [Rhizobiales bacterium NRL2]|jgi:peptidyl-prolyl cis-trans isomerase SurA|nr:MAG: hypothetical protein TEF_19040 [Rhizobiales bacterium NRL2]
MNVKLILPAIAAALWMAFAAPAFSQQVLDIVAVVDDEVISAYDLEERIDLIIVTADLPRTEETRQRLRPQVLRTLVDEELQKKAARNLGITVTNGDIDAEIEAIGERNNMSGPALVQNLERAGVDEHAIRQQVLAGIAWQRFIGARLLRTVDVSDEEIDEEIARLKAAEGETSYLVNEIRLAVEQPSQEDEVRGSAERLVRQIRAGASFAALARQFSSGATAQSGGDVGWIRAEQLGPEIGEVLPTMTPGSVSDPIRTDTGYAIVALRETRIEGQRQPEKVQVELSQILIPLGRNAPQQAVDEARARAAALRPGIAGCADAARLAGDVQGAQAADLGRLRIGDLPVDFRSAISDLDVGGVSPPLRTAAGIHLLIVCDRSEPVDATVDRERIRNAILNRKLNLRAQAQLRDLRRDSIVDYR